jgi:hypothetical protein
LARFFGADAFAPGLPALPAPGFLTVFLLAFATTTSLIAQTRLLEILKRSA